MERDVDSQSALRTIETAIIAREALSSIDLPPDFVRVVATKNHPDWFWACDECIGTGRGVMPDVSKVNVSMGTPFAAYVDRQFRCEDCQTDAVFSASEQKHWFETLGFLIWVYPKQCAACRARRRSKSRANLTLARSLENLDTSDPTQLEAIAKLYEEIGCPRKATVFRARAKNKRR